MNIFELTRRLIDIESISGNEQGVALYLKDRLAAMGAEAKLQEAEPGRPNVLAHWGRPEVVLSTHLDTVPPFFASREDGEFIYGRGACDIGSHCNSHISQLVPREQVSGEGKQKGREQ